MPNADANIQLLTYIAQNADMGKKAIKQLLPVIQDQDFQALVESQYREYDEIDDLAVEALHKRRQDAPGVPVIAQVSSYLMIHLNQLKDGDVSSMAEMMLKGSNQGILEITKHLNSAGDRVDREAEQLARRLMKFEQENVEALKPFLRA